jgi:23S rRNA pseudouridine1911/1915/1917 synthase
MESRTFHVEAGSAGLTLAATLKRLLGELSWSQVRKLIAGRRVRVHGNLCLDEERKVAAGDVIQVLERPTARPVSAADVKLAYFDEHLIVVHKPAGVTTLRHREEGDLPERRKQLQPTLDELVQEALAAELGVRQAQSRERPNKSDRRLGRRRVVDKRLAVRAVHRLDRDTSGVMLFTRTAEAEQKLVRMFARHSVERAYVAVVPGRVAQQMIETWLVRDRGDGLRGSTPLGAQAEGAQRAVTHVRPLETLADYTIVECRLETGRTHQIRIHLSELGHPLCGEKVYTHQIGQRPFVDQSGAPRQALHAAELALVHPMTGQPLRFRMALPRDLKEWIVKLRGIAIE